MYPYFRVQKQSSTACSVLQAEITVILKAAECLLTGGIFPGNLQIYSGSQAAIKFLSNIVSSTVFVHKCSGFFREI